MSTLIHRRVAACRAGTFAQAICRVHSGWVVLGDVQFLRGYSLLLPDPVVGHLNELNAGERGLLFHEAALVGDALLEITGAARINYEILGNAERALHAHLFPRYESEPEATRRAPVWLHDWPGAPRFDRSTQAGFIAGVLAGLTSKGRPASAVAYSPRDPKSEGNP